MDLRRGGAQACAKSFLFLQVRKEELDLGRIGKDSFEQGFLPLCREGYGFFDAGKGQGGLLGIQPPPLCENLENFLYFWHSITDFYLTIDC